MRKRSQFTAELYAGSSTVAVRGQAAEVARLKRDLTQAKEEVEILKKAAVFFAKELR